MNFIQKILSIITTRFFHHEKHEVASERLSSKVVSKTRIPYPYTKFKELENKLVADSISGRLDIETSNTITHCSNDVYYTSRVYDVTIRVDYPDFGGTFTYIFINGIDVSNRPFREFDRMRVVIAVRDRVDTPSTESSQSLYWM